MENITRITFCKNCQKLLYIRNLCSICTINFGNMRLKDMKHEIEKMNYKRMNDFDFNNRCELCGIESEIPSYGKEQQFCLECTEEVKEKSL